METVPHSKNFCGGNFQDWLEVMLINTCNGKCSFCIEKSGFKPSQSVDWKTLADTIISTEKTNILLLGGEPTLYPDLKKLINYLVDNKNKVYMTTNGSQLMKPGFVDNIVQLEGLNISIHHYDLSINSKITGINLYLDKLSDIIRILGDDIGVDVRINCNCISGYIDSKEEILNFIKFAKMIGANSVRFAELKNDDRFVDLAKIFNYQYGLNDDPFLLGCHQDAVINGMPVNFRQLCGMQTNKRPKPINPKQILKDVLYPDGKIYAGWQKVKDSSMKSIKDAEAMQCFKLVMKAILKQVESGQLSAEAATDCLMTTLESMKIQKETIIERKVEVVSESAGSGCVY